MPLTPEQLAALDTAADALKGADAKDVADGLKEKLSAPYQSVFARGFGEHKKESKAEMDGLKDQVTALTTERDEAREDAKNAGTKDADAAAKIERLEKALTDEKAGRTTDKTAAAERLKSVFAARERTALVADLVAAGVKKEWAEMVVAPQAASRIRVGDLADDGTAPVDYLDADGLTPLQAGRSALVAELVKGVSADYIVSNADGGSGFSGGQGGGNGLSSDVKRVQDSVDSRYAAADTQKAARERLGLPG